MTEQPEDLAIEEATEGDDGDDAPERGGRTKAGRRRQNFQGNAVQSLQRARKSTSGDDELTPRTTLLIGSAIAWALLDLADAVRSHGKTEASEE
jgi:hypothetical protein